jgi:hypothetical protein
VLDGRNRLAACKIAIVEPQFKEFTGDDPLGYVISLNLKRRHLNETQRAMIAAKIENMRQGERTDLEFNANLHKVSRGEAARLMNVSPRSVASAAQVLEHDTPELIAAVERRKLSVSAAARSLGPTEPTPGYQRTTEALSKISAAAASSIVTGCPKPTATPAKPAVEVRMREPKSIAAPDKEDTKEEIRRAHVFLPPINTLKNRRSVSGQSTPSLLPCRRRSAAICALI